MSNPLQLLDANRTPFPLKKVVYPDNEVGTAPVLHDPSGAPLFTAVNPGKVSDAGFGTDGASPPTITGTGVRGWLRAIYERLAGTLPVSLTSVPLASGASTSARQDTGNAALGTPADAVYSGTGAASIVSLLKGACTALLAATPAGTNLIGKVGLDQTTPGTTNGVVVNTSALPTGAATAANQASELAALGAPADSAYTGTGSASIVAALKGLYTALLAATPAGGNVIGSTTLRSAGTARSATVGTTATNLMPANTSRQGWKIKNDSTGDVWINFDATASAAAGGGNFRIPPGGYMASEPGFCETGAMSAIGSAASLAVTAREH